jgi:hypothetical protein
VYDEAIIVGAFATPYPTVLSGPEEYWNCANESGNGVTDDRCVATLLAPVAGSPTVADLTFNKVKGAPEFIPNELPNSTITELSGDGEVGVGVGTGIIRWTPSGGPEQIGGDGELWAGISRNGRTMLSRTKWNQGPRYGRRIGLSRHSVPSSSSLATSSCRAMGRLRRRTVVGLNWLDCGHVTAFQDERTGMSDLGFLGDRTTTVAAGPTGFRRQLDRRRLGPARRILAGRPVAERGGIVFP